MRRLVRLIAVALLVGGIAASGIVAHRQFGAATASAAPDTEAPDTEAPDAPDTGSATGPETAAVTTVDLIDEQEIDGRLGYGEASSLKGAGGVITRLPEPGTILEQGDTAWDVDGHAGPAVMYGDLPQYRALDRNADDGPDILQLEQYLTQLGFGDELYESGTIDDEFDNRTREAVRDWQESRGLERTGVVAIGDLVVIDGPKRVDKIALDVGDRAEGVVIEVTDPDQVVTLDVAIDELELFTVGDAVIVELPDDRRVEGTVTEIAKTADAADDGSVTVEVSIGLTAPEPSLVAAPVAVVIQETRADDAVVVPIRALLALAEGGYAVEKQTGNSTTLIGVELGEFGDGVVQITSGDLVDGDRVVVAP